MSRERRQKGTSFVPVVERLKTHPDRHKLVPEPLWRYFDDHLLISGWYPEDDYFALLQAVVKTFDAKAVGGDVWRYFARFSAQRDLAGVDVTGEGPADPKADAKAVYRNFAADMSADPAQLFRRASRLWSQYHDSGNMALLGGRTRTNSVFVRLAGFHIPVDGFVRLQGFYLEEWGRLGGVELTSRVTKSTARGHECCEWEYALARTPPAEAFVAAQTAM